MKEKIPELSPAQQQYREMMLHFESFADSRERKANETVDNLYYVVSEEEAKSVLDKMGISY